MRIDLPQLSDQVKDLSTALPSTILTFKFKLDNTLKTYLFYFLSQVLSICVEPRETNVSLSYVVLRMKLSVFLKKMHIF